MAMVDLSVAVAELMTTGQRGPTVCTVGDVVVTVERTENGFKVTT